MRGRFAVSLGALACAYALAPEPASASVDRPPQFVVISFDNCSELERWRELSEFLADANRTSDRVRFTFFVSGTNFLSDGKRALYQPPQQARGASNIGFGGSPEDVERRIAYLNKLRASGNEIASHAVGHFDGKLWTAADWSREFRSHEDLLVGVVPNNGLPAGSGPAFAARDIVGFRAPYLSRNAALYEALRTHRFRYDASGVGEPNAWPEKRDGVWRFNLANVRLAGSAGSTISMDYNFFVVHSLAINDPRRHAQFREEMLRTYLNYFRGNYAGNRAPIHIGHHFFNMQGGVYNQALLEFARAVCGMPEVRCATYTELADFLDGVDPATLKAYQSGAFPRMTGRSADLPAERGITPATNR